MKESKIELAVTKYAKTLGWESVKNQGQGNKGKPDRYFIKEDKRIIFVEFKTSTGEVSKLQEREINSLHEKGFYVVTIHSIEQGKELFDTLEIIKEF